MKKYLMTVISILATATLALAQGGGMMGGGTMGGSGMLVIADDGSVLVTEMGMGRGMMGNPGELDRELINIGPDGSERWRASFEEGWPMRPVTDGDMVVLSLADDWWTGHDGWGDGGWGHHGGGKHHGDDDETGHGTLVALDLATGQELWRLELDGDMLSMPQFTEDGTRLYLTVMEMDGGPFSDGPWNQGEAHGSGMFASSTLVALNRAGTVLWTLELDDDHMGGGPLAAGGVQ